MKTVTQIVLIAIIIVLAYLLYSSVEKPIQFEKEKKARYEAAISRLKDIRKAELAYKDVNGKFTGNWDSLISFVKNGTLPLVRKIGMLTDSMIEAGWTEKKALKEGKIIRDTVRVSVLDSIFNKNYNINDINKVPVKDTTAYIELAAKQILTGSGLKVPVFEAKVHNNVLLHGLNRQEIINLNEASRMNSKYLGLKVGSLEEANNNAGNWE